MRTERRQFDAVVAGSGLAGLMLSLELVRRGLSVALVSKSRLLESNSSWAQGGLAAVTGDNPVDSNAKHLEDTLNCGAGLTDEFMAGLIIESGRHLVEYLERLGVAFDREGLRRALGREGGHSEFRVLHNKDASGLAITKSLTAAVRSSKGITIYENVFVLDVVKVGNRAAGLKVIKQDGSCDVIRARHTVLATGGLGQIFARTTNPGVATGDGIAAAYRAGAALVDMEFVQFHPTALYVPGAPAALITEAVRGAGAHLVDHTGERFVFRFHPKGELATRDVVSSAIFKTMKEQGKPCVYLDLRPVGAGKLLEEFPNIVSTCRNWGYDPLEDLIPVAPAAHYFMGGIWTDEWARTTVEGLYAIGECASCGLHGANRLASNSLLEAGVMAIHAAESIASSVNSSINKVALLPCELASGGNRQLPESFMELHLSLKDQATKILGLVRHGSELESFILNWSGYAGCDIPNEREAAEFINGVQLAILVARGALARRESRGAHQRQDYPSTDPGFRRRLVQSLSGDRYIAVGSPSREIAAPVHSVGAAVS